MPHRDLLHAQRLEHGVGWVGIKSCLELGEQLAGDGGDVSDAGHWEQDAFGSGVVGDSDQIEISRSHCRFIPAKRLRLQSVVQNAAPLALAAFHPSLASPIPC